MITIILKILLTSILFWVISSVCLMGKNPYAKKSILERILGITWMVTTIIVFVCAILLIWLGI